MRGVCEACCKWKKTDDVFKEICIFMDSAYGLTQTPWPRWIGISDQLRRRMPTFVELCGQHIKGFQIKIPLFAKLILDVNVAAVQVELVQLVFNGFAFNFHGGQPVQDIRMSFFTGFSKVF
jgi:hypothetical protein